MSDIRDAVNRVLADNINFRDHEFPNAADALLAEFVIVPHSEVRWNYGFRHTEPHGRIKIHESVNKRDALTDAKDWLNDDPDGGVVEAVQCPIMPWTPITEDGQP